MFFHSSVDGHFGYLYLAAIISNAAMNIHEHILRGHMVSILLGMYLVVEFLGHMVILCLNFLRTAELFFQGRCTFLHFKQQCIVVSVFPHPFQYVLLPVYFIIAMLSVVILHLILVLICISLEANGVGCHALLQGIFLSQGLKLCFLQLLHCRQIFYC